MNSQQKFLTAILPALILSGCATTPRRAAVVMKISDSEAHVGMGSKEVSVGDHVVAYRNNCHTHGGGKDNRTSECHREDVGHGTVSKVINENYSVVKFDPGTAFSENDVVEKHGH